ncbi:MAG: hypothetical protein KatS3mg085_078 [Candidatus Dojkabacteria bacterium]|nr:MAG: hypothetical protein KatS3mg085_078 [Candidatus Dojkabacteria bacterium]
MKSLIKFILFLIFISSSLLVGFSLGIYMFSTMPNENKDLDEKITSYPVSNPLDEYSNDGDTPTNLNTQKVKIAQITDQDVVKILENETMLTASLSRKNWIDAKFSPNGKNLALVGMTNDIYDIYVYDLESKDLNQFTFYSQNAKEGVSSYIWISNDQIYFTQGPQNNMWLHSLDLVSGEILKISRLNANILEVNDLKNRILLKDSDSSFYLATIGGELMYKIENKSITDVFFTSDDNILFVNYTRDDDMNVGYLFLGSSEINPIENMKRSEIMCSQSDYAIGFNYENNDLFKVLYENKKVEPLVKLSDINKITCSNFVAFAKDSESNWFEIDIQNKQVKEKLEFKNYVDVIPFVNND